MKTLAKGLAPAFFRYGGGAEDAVIYCVDDDIKKDNKIGSYPCLDQTRFFDLANFSRDAGWKVVFGLK